MKRIYWKGIVPRERISSINSIADIISTHGSVLEFKRFSDLSLGFVVETTYAFVKGLREELQNFMTIDAEEPGSEDGLETIIILLHITFATGTGKLEIEVPNVPG